MNRRLSMIWIIGGLAGLGLVSPWVSGAKGQAPRDQAQWVYKVAVFSYNPGERLSDERRAASFERALNEQAREGWEPVGTLLNRSSIQTVGGAVTTRDTTSFVAYRRPR